MPHHPPDLQTPPPWLPLALFLLVLGLVPAGSAPAQGAPGGEARGAGAPEDTAQGGESRGDTAGTGEELAGPGPVDPRRALEEGNRHFRAGRLEQALEAYRAGWLPGRPDPVLAYNLGTTAHHLGRLPEAVLWYRRAREASGRDRWLAENLARARRRLDAPRLPPPGLRARWAGHRWLPMALGALCAWVALTWLALRRWIPGGAGGVALERVGALGADRAADLLAGLGAALLLLALLLPLGAPAPAVLLEDCGDLPAGSEVWARPGGEDGDGDVGADGAGVVRYRVARPGGGELTCPSAAVGLVRP